MNDLANYIFTSESVGRGHPDKLADQIADKILDTHLQQDPYARVACEVLIKSQLVVLAGEITSKAEVDYVQLVRDVILDVGYNHIDLGMDGHQCEVIVRLDKQSHDIAQGVEEGQGVDLNLGAGDQGSMFGFACSETDRYLPASIDYAHQLIQRLDQQRENQTVDWLRPDAKCQVSVGYQGRNITHIPCVVLSTQHDPGVSHKDVKDYVIEEIISPVIPKHLLEKTQYLINPTGRFVIGGPLGDAGLTGRKIIVDTYGGRGGHGGGAFSGKDPTKVDRSAAYMLRYIAKNIVASKVAQICLIQVAYAIGMAKPVSFWVDDYETSKIPIKHLVNLIEEHFSLYPKNIITQLDLRKPIYYETSVYGHFGRDQFSWERLNQTDIFQNQL